MLLLDNLSLALASEAIGTAELVEENERIEFIAQFYDNVTATLVELPSNPEANPLVLTMRTSGSGYCYGEDFEGFWIPPEEQDAYVEDDGDDFWSRDYGIFDELDYDAPVVAPVVAPTPEFVPHTTISANGNSYFVNNATLALSDWYKTAAGLSEPKFLKGLASLPLPTAQASKVIEWEKIEEEDAAYYNYNEEAA